MRIVGKGFRLDDSPRTNRSATSSSFSFRWPAPPWPFGLRRAPFACIHERRLVGLTRFELVTPRLSSVCSNQLSYRPDSFKTRQACKRNPRCIRSISRWSTSAAGLTAACSGVTCSRKEVIQPQVLLQLPCYDFTPITDHTLGACLPCGLAQRLLVQPAFVM